MSIQTTKIYRDPDTDIFLAVEADGFKVGVGPVSLEFGEIHLFPLSDQIDYMIDLFTTAKGDLEKLQ